MSTPNNTYNYHRLVLKLGEIQWLNYHVFEEIACKFYIFSGLNKDDFVSWSVKILSESRIYQDVV